MADDSLSFGRDIKHLFRDRDVDEMLSWFDLSKYEDVKEHAAAIHERIEDGSMPCDAEWSREDVDKFKSWMDAGCPE